MIKVSGRDQRNDPYMSDASFLRFGRSARALKLAADGDELRLDANHMGGLSSAEKDDVASSPVAPISIVDLYQLLSSKQSNAEPGSLASLSRHSLMDDYYFKPRTVRGNTDFLRFGR